MNPGASRASEPEPELTPVDPSLPNDLRALRPWRQEATPHGDALVCAERQPRPACAECDQLQTLLGDPRLSGFRMDQAVYLDIEATGLSHGAGTLAFLIGLAWFEGDELVFEQLFVDDPRNEMGVLSYFLDLLDRFDYLVSFNGKSYDLSVLHSRLVVNRLLSEGEVELKLRPHLDLLHTSRQAYKGVLSDTKLQTMEREVLQIDPAERADDVPGSLVPALYFHYLQTGYARHLEPVLTHNRTDVLSMVSLTRHLLTLFESPERISHPGILYNLGRAALRRRLDARAADLIGRAVDSGRLPQDRIYGALLDLITATRRVGRLSDAIAAATAARVLVPEWDQPERARLGRQITRYERKIARAVERGA